MAKSSSQGSVRIGIVSLFVLVMVVCLSVMAVLALSTANAERYTTERAAESTSDLYENEAQAQRFISEIDSVLASFRAETVSVNDVQTLVPPSESPVVYELLDGENALGETGIAQADYALSTQLILAIEDVLPQIVDIVEYTPLEVGETNEYAELVTGSAAYFNTLDGHLEARFVCDGGRTLFVYLVINVDATYTIRNWEATTQWSESADGEKLWSGA